MATQATMMGVEIAQGIFEAFGIMSAAKDQAAQLEQSALMNEYNAAAALRQSNFNVNQFYKQFDQNMGQGLARIGASNLRSDTFEDLVYQNVEEAAIQAENMRHEGAMQAYNEKNAANMKRYQAKLGKYNAKVGAITPLFGAATKGYMAGKQLGAMKPQTAGVATGAPIDLTGGMPSSGGFSGANGAMFAPVPQGFGGIY